MGHIYALSGWKRSGKDFMAKVLQRDYGFCRLAFADALKDTVSEQYDIHRSVLDDQELKEMAIFKYPANLDDKFTQMFKGELRKIIDTYYWTPRALCILEGQLKRAIDPDIWVNKIVDIIDSDPKQNFVISDLRFRSEADRLEKLYKGRLTTVRIERFEQSESKDISETDLDSYPFDVYLDNRGTLFQFEQRIKEWLKK